MSTVTRANIVESLTKQTSMERQRSALFLEKVLAAIGESLADGQKIKLVRFGSFSVRNKRSRIGRNPKTGQEAEISARRVVSFRASPILRKRIDDAHRHRGGPDQ